MGLTVWPGEIQVWSDYLNIAEKLLEAVPVRGVRLLNPKPRHLELVIDAANPLIELVACECLRETWPYDWMPVGASLEFVAGSFRP